jgi:hypothetical protein
MKYKLILLSIFSLIIIINGVIGQSIPQCPLPISGTISAKGNSVMIIAGALTQYQSAPYYQKANNVGQVLQTAVNNCQIELNNKLQDKAAECFIHCSGIPQCYPNFSSTTNTCVGTTNDCKKTSRLGYDGTGSGTGVLPIISLPAWECSVSQSATTNCNCGSN